MAENARPPIDGGTVLVTGASSGIGRELAVQLAPRARMLILLARRAGRLDELRTTLLARHPQLQVLTLPVDLSDEADVDRALGAAAEQAGTIDVLVNNAGVGDQALARVSEIRGESGVFWLVGWGSGAVLAYYPSQRLGA